MTIISGINWSCRSLKSQCSAREYKSVTNASTGSPSSCRLMLNLALSYITLCFLTKCDVNFSDTFITPGVILGEFEGRKYVVSLRTHCIDQSIDLCLVFFCRQTRCSSEPLKSPQPLLPLLWFCEVKWLGSSNLVGSHHVTFPLRGFD